MNEQLISELKVTGVTPADVKFVEAHIANQILPDYKTVQNPFSGVTHETTPLIATLTRFVQDISNSGFSERACSRWGISKGQMVQKFDRARYLILKLDCKLYSDIVD